MGIVIFFVTLRSSIQASSSRVIQSQGGAEMRYGVSSVGLLTALMLMTATVVVAEEADPLKPRVPADQIAEAKANKNPIPNTPENVAKGKALFEGKGTCFNCHGQEGKGDGPAGQILNPSP